MDARIAASELAVDEVALDLAPSGSELSASAAGAVDEAWDRLLRVDLPREARRGVPRLLRVLVDLPVFGLGAWVLYRTVEGFIAEQYVGVDFLVTLVLLKSYLYIINMCFSINQIIQF